MDQVSQVNERWDVMRGAAQQLIQLIEDSLDSIHGAMPVSRRHPCSHAADSGPS